MGVSTNALIFQLLLFGHAAEAESLFLERVVETIVGVGVAYLFGLALPALLDRRSASGRQLG